MSNKELMAEKRCTYCGKKSDDDLHDYNLCVKNFKGMKAYEVNKMFLENSAPDFIPKNPNAGLGGKSESR